MNYYYVYVLTNYTNTVVYIGVTNNLERRVAEHKSGTVEGFTKKYKVNKLVYYEVFGDINAAIMREKYLKGWIRAKKDQLISQTNPAWEDLSLDWK